MANRVLAYILRRSGWILLAIAALTAPSVYCLTQAEFSPSIVESFVDNRQDYLDVMKLEEEFQSNPDALIWLATIEGEELFSADSLLSIRRAASDIEQLSAVRSVVALPNLTRPSSLQSGARGIAKKVLLNSKLKQGEVPSNRPAKILVLPPSIESGSLESLNADLKQLGESAREKDNHLGRLVSNDGRAQVMLIELETAYDISPFDQTDLIDQLMSICAKHGLGREGIHCSGLIPLQAYSYDQIDAVLYGFLPLGGILIAMSVVFVFHRIDVVFVTLIIAAISISWGVALGMLAYGKFSVLMAAVPLMVLVISTADVIHLLSSYSAERKQGADHELALAKTFREVGGACVLTSLTTFIGFASLVLVPSNTIRQFGFATAAGVASALLLSVILVPMFLQHSAKRDRPLIAKGSSNLLATRLSNFCLGLATRQTTIVLVVFALLLVGSAMVSWSLRIDPDLTKRFKPRHEVTIGTAYFSEQFGGINSVEVVLRGTREELCGPQTLAAMAEFKDQCLLRVGVTDVLSLEDVVSQALRQLDYRNEEGLAESAGHAEATLRYVRNLDGELIDNLVSRNFFDDSDQVQTRVLIRIQQTSYMEMLDASNEIVQLAGETFPASIEISEKGSAPLVGEAVRQIIVGHMQGFAICFSCIFFLITFGLKSLQLGCLSVLPNLTPLFFLGGLIGLTSDAVDSDILAVATLGLGLAVDDTIHFLSRFKIEFAKTDDLQTALRQSMDHTGQAIIRTTLILAIGFAPFAFSGYWSISMLGTHLVAVLFAAVFADLIFLPAIVYLLYGRRAKP